MADVSDINEAWHKLVAACVDWTNHMDQWEKFKFATEYGDIWVAISMKSDGYPDSYDRVDPSTGQILPMTPPIAKPDGAAGGAG